MQSLKTMATAIAVTAVIATLPAASIEARESVNHDPERCYPDAVKGSGNLVRVSRNVSSFDSIDLRSAADIVIRQGARSITLEGDDNILPLVTTEVVNGELQVNHKTDRKRSLCPTKKVVVTLSTPSLDRLKLSGAGDISIIDWRSDALAIRLNGAGDVDVGGKIGRIDAILSGAGGIDLTRADVEYVEAKVSGAGNIDAGSPGRLRATVSGVGNIYYSGSPMFEERHVSGIGSIRSK